MPTETIDRARALIEARLAELDAEAGGLRSALEGLGQGRERQPRRARKSHTAARGRKTSGRAPRGRRREQLLAGLKANPGARPSELARKIGITANQVQGLIKAVRKDKLIVKKDRGYALGVVRGA